MKSSKYSLDTHPLIWYFSGQKSLSRRAKKVLDRIFSGELLCFLSAIVLLEAFHLSLKKKEFIFPNFLKKLRLENIIIVPVDKIILSSCYHLPKKLTIHDRVIAATAEVNKCVLLTKDKEIQKQTRVQTVW